MTGLARARELLDMIDVDFIGLEEVLFSLLVACRDAEDKDKHSLLLEAIELSMRRERRDWPAWVDCLIKEGPNYEELLKVGLLTLDELPEPQDLKKIALRQSRQFMKIAHEFWLDGNCSMVPSLAVYEFESRARDLEEWAGVPPRLPTLTHLQPPEDLDEFDKDENGVIQGWVIDEKTGNTVPKGTLGSHPNSDPTDALVAEMNTKFCAVLDGGGFSIFMRDQDPAFGRPFWARLSREAFRHYFEDDKVQIFGSSRDRPSSRADVWLAHPKRQKYRGIVMDPQGLPENEGKLNLWQGWAVRPQSGDWSLMRNLVEEVLCDNDGAASDYVFKWIAFMLQRPWETPEAAIAFRGDEGTGKGTLGRALMQIAGPHGLTVSSPGQLSGRFNSHLRDCVFLFADEAVWPGDKSAEGMLKQLVTEPVISYEAKGKDLVPGRNMVHLMLASNEQWVVPAGKGARRFFVTDVSNRRRQDREYFTALWKQMDSGGLAAMVHDLMNLDLTGWHPSRGIPSTQALADQKVLSLEPVNRFWLDLLNMGVLPVTADVGDKVVEWSEATVELGPRQRSEMTGAYDAFLKRNRILSARPTHKALVNSGKRFGLETCRSSGGSERMWRLPSLSVMRSRFEKMVGATNLFDD